MMDADRFRSGMLVLELDQFFVLNRVDAKYLLTSGDLRGLVIIRRSSEVVRTPSRALELQQDDDVLLQNEDRRRRILKLSTSVELSDREPPKTTSVRTCLNNDDDDGISVIIKLFNPAGIVLWKAMGFMALADYKCRPEKRTSVRLGLWKQPLASFASAAAQIVEAKTDATISDPPDGTLTLTAIYSHDHEHPSIWNHILCGVGLIPQAGSRPLERGDSLCHNDGGGGGGGASNPLHCGTTNDCDSAAEYSGTMKNESSEAATHTQPTEVGTGGCLDSSNRADTTNTGVDGIAGFFESLVLWPQASSTHKH